MYYMNRKLELGLASELLGARSQRGAFLPELVANMGRLSSLGARVLSNPATYKSSPTALPATRKTLPPFHLHFCCGITSSSVTSLPSTSTSTTCSAHYCSLLYYLASLTLSTFHLSVTVMAAKATQPASYKAIVSLMTEA